jgi:predicted ester cyclase
MSQAENKVRIRRFIEEVVNTGDIGRLHEFVAPDFREQYDPPGRVRGIEGCREYIIGVRTSYPGRVVTIEDQIAEGDLVATHVTMTGTHRGKWPPGAKATNTKRVRAPERRADNDRNGRFLRRLHCHHLSGSTRTFRSQCVAWIALDRHQCECSPGLLENSLSWGL